MASIKDIVAYADRYLAVSQIRDYCPNGLQVEGKEDVRVLVSGVTACESLIRAAIAREADALLVHHGYFWRNESPRIVGMKRRRLALLLEHRINLLAYHLPLDIHSVVGNNAYLRELLGIKQEGTLTGTLTDGALGGIGRFAGEMTPAGLSALLEEKLGRKPQHISGGKKAIRVVAWCSGAAQQMIETADQLGADAYISGEISEQTFHFATENRLDYYAIGHHASERGGPLSLGNRIAEKFSLRHEFIDIPNPV